MEKDMPKVLYNVLMYRWKAFFRSMLYTKRLIEKAFLSVGLISLWVPLIAFARFYGKTTALGSLREHLPLASVMAIYFFCDFVVRLVVGKPIAVPYEFLGLILKKRDLLCSVLILETLNPFTLTALIFFSLLAAGTIAPDAGLAAALFFISFTVLLSLFFTAVVLLVRLKSLQVYLYGLGLILLPVLLISQNLKSGATALFSSALQAIDSLNPIPHALIAGLTGLLVYSAYQYLIKGIDLDLLRPCSRIDRNKGGAKRQRVPHWLELEMRLMWRNHRPRTYLFTSIIAFIFFSLIPFLPLPKGQNLLIDFYRLASLLFLSGVYVYGFGAFAISFHSRFFSFIATQPIDLHRWIQFKYYYFAGSVLLLTLVSLILIVPFHRDLLFPFIAFALWNAGPASLAMLWFATHNIDRCDLGKGVFMNFQAWGFYPSLIAQSLFFVPVVLYGSAVGLWDGARAWIVPAVVSLPLLVLHRVAIKWIAANFSRRKFAVLQIFQADRGCG